MSEESDIPAVASQPGRWTIEYEAGDEGIEIGGALYPPGLTFLGLEHSPGAVSGGPGFTEVSTTRRGR